MREVMRALEAPLDSVEQSCLECASGLLARQSGDVQLSSQHFKRSIEADPGSPVAARSMIYLAGMRAQDADFDAAVGLLDRASQHIGALDRSLLELQMGFVAELRELFDDAVDHYGRAIELGRELNDPYSQQIALNNRANAARHLGRLGQAEVDLRVLLSQAGEDSRMTRVAHHNLGAVLGDKGILREALDRIDKAALSSEGLAVDESASWVTECEILVQAALYLECRHRGHRALRRSPDDGVKAALERPDLLVLMARASIGLGLLDHASIYFRAASTLFAEQDRRVSEHQCDLVVNLIRHREIPDIGPDDAGADAVYEALIAVGDRDPNVAEACWLAATRALESDRPQIRMLGHYAQGSRFLAAGEIGKAKEQVETILGQLPTHMADINAVELRSALVFGYVDIEGLAVRIARAGDPVDLACLIDQANTVVHSQAPLSEADTELAERLELLRSTLSRSAPGTVDPAEIEFLEDRLRSFHHRLQRCQAPESSACGINALQDPGSSATVVMFAESEGHVWRLIVPSAPELRLASTLTDLGPRNEILRAIRRHRLASDSFARRPVPVPQELVTILERRSSELDATLFSGVEIAPGTEVVIFPGRFLSSVPWRCLASVKDWTALVNVGTPFVNSVEPRRTQRDERVKALIVGGPCHGKGILNEVEAVAACYDDPIVLTGKDATVAAVLEALEHVDIAHIAGHGSLHPRDPLLAMVTLADGPLTVYDIELSSATPATVVLGACLIAAGGRVGNDIGFGFASALVSRGTTQLVISPVELNDDETTVVMPLLHRALLDLGSAREALESLSFEETGLQHVVDSLAAVETRHF